MKKISMMLGVVCFSFHCAQLSKVDELNTVFNQKHKEIADRYKEESNVDRKKEEVKIIIERLDGYEEAIKNIQIDETKIDPEILKKGMTKFAEYEIGIDGFRNTVAQYFDVSAATLEEGVIRTTARFLVDELGRVSNITAHGDYREFNLLTIITLYQILDKGKWKPAELNGIPIQSIFILPVTMQFE